MIKIEYDNLTQQADLSLGDSGLEFDESFSSSVLISLYSDARAKKEDEPPDYNDLRGWWANDFEADVLDKLGSKLWVLGRSKTTTDALRKSEKLAKAALQWLIEDGIASDIKTYASYLKPGTLLLTIEIYKPENVAPRWKAAWEVTYAI